FFQAEDGIRDFHVTGVQTCALPIYGCVDAGAVLEHGDGLAGALRHEATPSDSARWCFGWEAPAALRLSPSRQRSGDVVQGTARQIGRASWRERMQTPHGAETGQDRR